MQKKSLSIILAVVMVLSICPVVVFAEKDITSYLTYEIVDGEVTITDCDESISGDVVIPNTIEGYPVTTIGNSAFSVCMNIEKVEIPDSVTTLGKNAFRGCRNLKSVTLSKSLKVCGQGIFNVCDSLTEIIFPEGMEVVPANLFFAHHDIANPTMFDIVIPESVKRIEEKAFFQFWFLNNVTVSESIEYIGKNAFEQCLFLDEITLYNKDIVLDEKSIGYSDAIITGDRDDFFALFNEFFLACYPYSADEYDEEKLKELRTKIMSMVTIYDEPQPDPNFTIYGYKGSTAEAYAIENGLKFVEICEHNYVSQIIKEPSASQTGIKADVCEYCGNIVNEEEIPMLSNGKDESPDNSEAQDNPIQNIIDTIVQFFQKIIDFFKSIFMR